MNAPQHVPSHPMAPQALAPAKVILGQEDSYTGVPNKISHFMTYLYRSTVAVFLFLLFTVSAGRLCAQGGQSLEIWFQSDRSGNTEIWKMNPDGSALQQMTTNVAGSFASQPCPSHDGTKIAYFKGYGANLDLRIMDGNGLNDRLVKTFPLLQQQQVMDWLPDNSQILIYNGPWCTQIYSVSLDGSSQSLFIDPAVVGRVSGSYVRFSPDGQRVAFTAGNPCQDGELNTQVFVANYTNGNVDLSSIAQVTKSTGGQGIPVFSGDGSLIAAYHNIDGGPSAGHTYPINTIVFGSSGETNITPNFYDADDTDWGGGGKILLQARQTSDDTFHIYSINGDGSELTALTSGSSTDALARWRLVSSAPQILSQPVSQTVSAGSSVTFSVQASGQPKPTYQWQFGGIDIPGATNSSYQIPAASVANIGLYDVNVSNPVATVQSTNAALSLLNVQLFPGLILYGPTNGTYNIQSIPVLGGVTNWTTLTNVTLNNIQPFIFIDFGSLTNGPKFYRAELQ